MSILNLTTIYTDGISPTIIGSVGLGRKEINSDWTMVGSVVDFQRTRRFALVGSSHTRRVVHLSRWDVRPARANNKTVRSTPSRRRGSKADIEAVSALRLIGDVWLWTDRSVWQNTVSEAHRNKAAHQNNPKGGLLMRRHPPANARQIRARERLPHNRMNARLCFCDMLLELSSELSSHPTRMLSLHDQSITYGE